MSISEKLTQLNGIKQDIKQSLIDKGQAATDDMGEYSTLISNISGSSDDSFKNAIERKGNPINLPSDLTKIGDYAFFNYKNLVLTSLPEGITSIGAHAFNGCTNLALTSLPEGITSIGYQLFYNCKQLALTSIPEGITSIGGNAFYSCTSLTTLTFKGTPNTIESTAFRFCTNLTTINVPWSEGAVANAPWGATNATINYDYVGE